MTTLLGTVPPVRFEFWDGSSIDCSEGRTGTVRVHSPHALRRIVWAPGELGVARAYVAGDLDVEGDIVTVLERLRKVAPRDLRFGPGTAKAAVEAALAAGAVGSPPPPPPEEATFGGWRHSVRRDAAAVRHHYDVGNPFYRLVLGPSLTYSCARFDRPGMTLEEAQASKHELVCRKLGLHERPGARLLDVGCGWGSMAIHAAQHHAARVVAITISPAQADLARARVVEAKLSERIEIRLADYRELEGEGFDAISSIGMFEHVGERNARRYFEILIGLLRPQGRLLNHAISTTARWRLPKRGFMHRYVFPDAELVDIGRVAVAMERAGFEVRDVESLREHYETTLRHWLANLEGRWDEAVGLVGRPRARIWRLYMAGCSLAFRYGGLGVHQALAVVADPAGSSGMPATRDGWATTLGRPDDGDGQRPVEDEVSGLEHQQT